eukprot:17464-Heterococcus_DN1.PRE.1
MDSDMDTNSDEQALPPDEEKEDHFLAFGVEPLEEEVDEDARHLTRPPVWLHSDDAKADNPAVRAHNEILRFCDLIAPTPAELRAAKAAEDFSRSMVERVLGTGPELHVFGSRATGLLLPQSDLDMCLLDAPFNALDQLARELRRLLNTGEVRELQVIAQARVPIVAYVHAGSGISCDICFNQPTSVESARMICEYLEEYTPARCLILCQWNDDAQQGLKPNMNLGALLMNFLNLFGNIVSLRQDAGLSLRHGGHSYTKPQRGWVDFMKPWALSIENPFDSTIDVGKNSYEIRAILESFA